MNKEKKQIIKNGVKLNFIQRKYGGIIKSCFDNANYISYCLFWNYCVDNSVEPLTINEFVQLLEQYTKDSQCEDNIKSYFPCTKEHFLDVAYSNKNDIN